MKLYDCVSKNSPLVELLIVFSEAAYEAARIGRDCMTQAILPIDRSFFLEDELAEVLDNDESQSLIAAIGVGFVLADSYASMERTFDITKTRYGKIIVVTQQGKLECRASNEVLRFFFTYMQPLIDGGHVYVLEAPLELAFAQSEFVAQVLNSQTRRLRIVNSKDDLESQRGISD
ncbi:MAG: hypothetical protein P4L46_09935 [Fimbriimonas sp.]|nr:hypothetical protein [Fimbriimonas sp.]